MDRHAPGNVYLQPKTLKRGNRIHSSVKIQKKKDDERKGKSKIRKGKREKSCQVSSGFKNPTVVLECIDTYLSENLQKKRVVLGDKTNLSPKTFCDKKSKIISPCNSITNAKHSLKNLGMDTLLKSQIRQSPRVRTGSGDSRFVMKPCSVVLCCNDVPNLELPCTETALRKQSNRDDGSVLNETLSNNFSADIQDALQTSGIRGEHCSSKSKTTERNMKSAENCQNVNEDSTRTLIACESSKENRKDGRRVRSNQDSPSLRRCSNRQSFKESQLCEKESVDSKNNSVNQRNINSADVSEKTVSHCVYSKVQRDTMKNNCLPIEEKLALYEFEVDENEPLVKRKQKRNVYVRRKKRNLFGDPTYHSSLKIGGTKPKNTVYDTRTKKLEEPAEEMHSSPKVINHPCVKEVQNPDIQIENLERVNIESRQEKINSSHNIEEKHVHFNDLLDMKVRAVKSPIPRKVNSAPLSDGHNSITCVSESGKILNEIGNISLRDTPKSGGSRTSERVKRRVMRENLENCPPKSPITRPSHGRTPLRKFKDLELSEFQMEWSGNGSNGNCNFSLSENQSTELQNATNFGTSIGSMRIMDKSDLMNRQNVVSCLKSTPEPTIASHSTPEKFNSEKTNVTGTEKEDFWSPIPAMQSPSFSSVDKGDKSGSTINSSLNKSFYRSIPLSRKVFFLPRISGGGNNITSEEGSERKWDVENFFGFNDENEEEENIPLFKIPSANKSISKRPFSSTPVNFMRVKPLPTRLNVKRKIETLSEDRQCKSPRLEDEDKILKTLSKSASGVTPFSNPLKQTKLDFAYESVANTSRKVNNYEATTSPALFKDNSDDDKTPTHFTQPPRRSYNRLLRKNLKFVGDDWIEVDEDDGESLVDEEKSKRRTKRSKSRKKEEKEASKWIKDFNSKCEEIEDFELCVE